MVDFSTIPAVIGPEPNTAEWLSARDSLFGASDAAAALGLSPYKSPFELYCEKKGLVAKFTGNAATRLGQRMEPVVLAEYETITGRELHRPVPLLISKEFPFIGATPDSLMDGDGGIQPVEAKTTTWRRAEEFGEEGTDEIPTDYVLQTQQQMLVVGASKCDVAVLLDGRTLKLYTVHRHEKLIESIIKAERELWERIQNNDPPEPDFSRPDTLDLVKSMHITEPGKTIIFDRRIEELWNRYRSLRDQVSLCEREQDAIKAEIFHAMGDAEAGLLPDGDIELVCSEISRKSYTVEASTYKTLKQKKVKR